MIPIIPENDELIGQEMPYFRVASSYKTSERRDFIIAHKARYSGKTQRFNWNMRLAFGFVTLLCLVFSGYLVQNSILTRKNTVQTENYTLFNQPQTENQNYDNNGKNSNPVPNSALSGVTDSEIPSVKQKGVVRLVSNNPAVAPVYQLESSGGTSFNLIATDQNAVSLQNFLEKEVEIEGTFEPWAPRNPAFIINTIIPVP